MWDFTILGLILSSLRGKYIFEKSPQTKTLKSLKNYNVFQATKLQLGVYIYTGIPLLMRNIETTIIFHSFFNLSDR